MATQSASTNNIFTYLLLGIVLVIPPSLYYFETSVSEQQVVDTALSSAKAFALASENFREFYIKEVMPVAKSAGIGVGMAGHTAPDELPLAYSVAIDVGENAYTLEYGGSRFISDAPWRERAPMSEVDQLIWNSIKIGQSEATQIYENGAGRKLVYAKAIHLNDQFCVDCHNTHPESPQIGWKLGDLRAAELVELSLPTSAPLFSIPGLTYVKGVWILGVVTMAMCIFLLLMIQRNKIREAHVQMTLQQQNKTHENRYLQTISRLSGGVAHHFNNIFAVVLGSSELIGLRHGNVDEVNNIQVSAQRGASLVKRLLQISRQHDFELENIKLSEFLRTRSSEWDEQVSAAALEYELQLEEDLVVRGSVEVLTTILEELLSNAVEHAGSYISLRAHSVRDSVVINVANDCVGQCDLERMKEPFFTTLGPERAGLGLAAVDGLAETIDATLKLSQVGDVFTASIILPAPNSQDTIV